MAALHKKIFNYLLLDIEFDTNVSRKLVVREIQFYLL